MQEARDGRLTPDEMITALHRAGIRTSRTTLARWVRQGLVTPPLRGSGGRGVGRFSLYPPEAVGEAAASAVLLAERVPPEVVAEVRRVATADMYLDQVLRYLGLGTPSAIAWGTLAAAWLLSAAKGNVPPFLPPELERLVEPPSLYWRGRGMELLVQLWVYVRDRVNAGGRAPEGEVVTFPGPLKLKRTPYGSYRFAT